VLDKTPPDVTSGVVTAVRLLPAVQTLELVTVTIVLVSEPTVAVTAPLTRVRRSHVIHVDTVLLGFVFDVTLEFAERPLLELTGVRDAFPDVRQVLERDSRTIILHGFPDGCCGDAVETTGAPPSESRTDALGREVCGAGVCLLAVAAPTFVFVAAVVAVVPVAEEPSGTGDGDVSIHVQLYTENHSVLGFFVIGTGRFEFFLHGDVEDVLRFVILPRIASVETALPVDTPVSAKRVVEAGSPTLNERTASAVSE